LNCSVGYELVEIDSQRGSDADSMGWIGTAEMADLA